MSYVKSVLQPGEEIVMRGRLHWIAYWQAIIYLVLGSALVWWEYKFLQTHRYGDTIIGTTAIIFGVLFLYSFLRAWFKRWITEIAVTNRRIIYKTGLVYRHTEEMNMDKVASVDVDQSILGRMLDYGTVHIIGTGGAQTIDHESHGIEHLHQIAQPLALRNAITAK